jgi:hypothetical protein
MFMNGMYESILSAEPLKKVEAHRKTTRLMCQQTTECALFIRDYASRTFSMDSLYIYRNFQVTDLAPFKSKSDDYVTDQRLY